MRGEKVLDIEVAGRVSVWANPPYDRQWTKIVIAGIEPFVKTTLRECAVRLEFFISRERLTLSNDLDNLAKPVLDALHRIVSLSD